MDARYDAHLARLGPWIVGAACLALLAGAFAFQYLGGLQPCVLCIWQRWPHGIGAALAILAALLPLSTTGRPAAAALMIAAGVVLLIGAGIAAFHVGVEQHWWAGTSECGGTTGAAASVEALRRQLLATPVVRCDEVAWSLFGISMAGWNLLLSIGLGALSFVVAHRIHRKRVP